VQFFCRVQKNNPPASTASIFWLIAQVTALSFRTVKCVIFVIHLTITNLREEEEKEIAVRAGVCRCWVLSKSCNYIHLKHFLRKGISRLERELAASAHKSEIIISPPDAPSSSLSALLLLLQFFFHVSTLRAVDFVFCWQRERESNEIASADKSSPTNSSC
jgi:hypothetical protein